MNLAERLEDAVQVENAADDNPQIPLVPPPSSIKSSSKESRVGSSKAEETLPKIGKEAEGQDVSGRNTPASPADDVDAEEDPAMEVGIPELPEDEEVRLVELV